MALGSAQTMGFRLMPNFDSPYFSTSIGEFWRRWHISLSTFFRDYVYVPLGGSRASRVRLYGNVMVTFVLSGVWHGAQWTFVVWGLLHGLFMLAGHLTAPARRRLGGALGRGPVVGGFLRLVAAFCDLLARDGGMGVLSRKHGG